ncbi:MAG TPA: hypothetical protein VK835_09785 [Bacteroidia bacterium]|nr:hypothetical protein [Bacteroidia bacterium]
MINEEDINKDNLNFSDEGDSFSLPENYFDSFSSRLFKKIAEEDELKDYPTLVSLQKQNPFTVPADYFELKEDLLQYPLLAENKTANFTVPDLYFDTLSERINNTISLVEEKEVYPLLYSHRKENIFATSENYFETFEVIVEKTNKVIPLYKRVKLQYRVAAAVTLIIGLAILFYKQQTKPTYVNDCNTFACLDKKDILNSGYVLRASDDNIIDLIDEKQLSDSLLLKKNGKEQKVDMTDVSDNVDLNTLTDNL